MARKNLLLTGIAFIPFLLVVLPASSQITIPNDPWGFTIEDIYGEAVTPGDTTYDPNENPDTFGTYTISADGRDIWDAADDFRYLHREMSGDFTISCCILDAPSGPATDPWSKCGVMVRQNNTPGSADVYQVTTRGNGVTSQWRDSQGADAAWLGTAEPADPAPVPIWVQLVREGDLFTYNYSLDGENWQHQSGAEHTVVMTDPVLVGICLTSHERGVLVTHKVTDFRINGEGPGTLAKAGDDQTVYEGGTVTLDGSGSTSTTSSLTYHWAQTSGVTVMLNNATSAVCTFDAPVIWDYTEELTFRLYVDDGTGGTSSDQVAIEIRNSLAYPAWPLEGAPGTEYFQDVLHLGSSPSDRILAPLDIQSFVDNLAAFGGSPNVNPVPGEAYDFTDTGVSVTSNPMVWTPVHSADGMFGNEPFDDFQQFYHIYILSPEDRDIRWHRRHDDEIRVWNNGVLVFVDNDWDNDTERTVPGHPVHGTGLSEGLNSITMMFEEGTGGNWIAVGITDLDGVPFDDLYYSFGPSFLLTDAYAARELPDTYQVGGTVPVQLSVRVNPDNTPSSVTVNESIPGGLTVVDAGGGMVTGGSINWTFSGGDVETQVIAYTLGVPAGTTGALNFTGTVSFSGTTEEIKEENVVYETPSAPANVYLEMLLAGYLSWSASPEEGIEGYRVFRSVNGGAWEGLAFVSGATSYMDKWIDPGSTYNYMVSAVNAAGIEGALSSPTGEQMIAMEVREAEDFNYGGGLYPGYQDCPAAVEAAAEDELIGTDFWHPNTEGPNEYRPANATPGGIAIETIAEDDNPSLDHTNIGWIDAGSWYRYTFDVPAPGPADPEGGWIKLVFRLAGPRTEAAVAAYWDETLIGIARMPGTGSWHLFDYAILWQQIQTTPGRHTLRVEAVDTDPAQQHDINFDKIGIGFNWSPSTREYLFTDNFEIYRPYRYDDLVDPLVGYEYTVVNGSFGSDDTWRVWYTLGQLLGHEDPAIAGMAEKYVVTNSSNPMGDVLDEELITPTIDCTRHLRVRLNFNKNYRPHFFMTGYQQIAEVDIRSSDDGVTWGDWVNLLHWDRTTVAEIDSRPEEVDIAAHADGKFIQIRWHFYDAMLNYWFAIDDVRVSGDKVEEPPPAYEVLTMGYIAGVADLTWDAFGGGNYTVQYTADLASNNWQSVPGTTWPITATNWSGDVTAILGRDVYLRVRSE